MREFKIDIKQTKPLKAHARGFTSQFKVEKHKELMQFPCFLFLKRHERGILILSHFPSRKSVEVFLFMKF